MTLKVNKMETKKELSAKICNKGYVLVEDLKTISFDAIDIIKKMYKDGLNEKLSQKKWAAELDKRCMYVVSKKGTIFFESKILKNKDGKPYLYSNNANKDVKDVIEPQDLLFGPGGPVTENDIFVLWESFLKQKEYIISLGKYEPIETEVQSFEQKHIVPALIETKKRIEKNIHNKLEYINQLDKIIDHIME
jgi:hypothetical protein